MDEKSNQTLQGRQTFSLTGCFAPFGSFRHAAIPGVHLKWKLGIKIFPWFPLAFRTESEDSLYYTRWNDQQIKRFQFQELDHIRETIRNSLCNMYKL